MLRNFFIGLSENQLLNQAAQKYGFQLGAQQVVAGTNIEEMIDSVKELNQAGISCTIDNLGEFVYEKSEAIQAKEEILAVVDAIREHQADAHLSIKPSQLGLDIDYEFCKQQVEEIVNYASKDNIFVNMDMENHTRLEPTFRLLDELKEQGCTNVGTVIQAYFHRAMDYTKKYGDTRIRLVKGAYKESPDVAYQDKQDIDENYIKIIEEHLLHGAFTSIATHDHRIIEHVKGFVEKHDIPREQFEFQMLYGFRKDLQLQLAKEGYRFCTYVPFGEDWYGYFMRRLAERPQNMNLMVKQVFTKRTNTVLGLVAGAFVLGRLSKRGNGDKKDGGWVRYR
ncbi:proline dehydrogenase [Sporosarcina sp. P37]|uniref:proline dehydrogenase family protein n=1 Tax=unclassified Sporosarcina TaxID=2647733 RepID=UPI000A17CCAD|nr:MULTISPECIES: proline dehydrogenase family protein [unclassified Sporosarcina]ARK23511.1 proline dehydrogenase [Sporosarcina sp. P37]PID17666.1 proline dehydrogenase [Sporosarcina sp. P35]